MSDWERHLNALMVIIISLILFGAFGVQIFAHETPCPLCFLQRLGMLGVACGAALNIRFGIHPAHYGLAMLSSALGGFIALRQIALHVCPGFPTFGVPFFGLSLYTWSFLVFACSVVYIALLMLIFGTKADKKPTLNVWDYSSFVLLFVAAFGNIIASLIQCGFGPCADVP